MWERTTFHGYRELGTGSSDDVLRLERVGSRVSGAGVHNRQFAGGRRDVDLQLGGGRQWLPVHGPAGRRCWNASDCRVDDQLLSASQRLRRLELVVVGDRRRSYNEAIVVILEYFN